MGIAIHSTPSIVSNRGAVFASVSRGGVLKRSSAPASGRITWMLEKQQAGECADGLGQEAGLHYYCRVPLFL
eukprot:410138-Rhodomonas_salina.2